MSEAKNYQAKPDYLSCTVASSATTSNAISLYGSTICAVQIPASFTGTTLGFLGSIDKGASFAPTRNSSGAISYTVAADSIVGLDPKDFIAYDQIKLVVASQGAERTINVKPFAV